MHSLAEEQAKRNPVDSQVSVHCLDEAAHMSLATMPALDCDFGHDSNSQVDQLCGVYNADHLLVQSDMSNELRPFIKQESPVGNNFEMAMFLEDGVVVTPVKKRPDGPVLLGSDFLIPHLDDTQFARLFVADHGVPPYRLSKLNYLS
jgi:hypothetical protein